MALTNALIDVLKRELKARGITYADLARQIGLSEASVKRMFSTRDFMLSRLDEICEFAGIDLSDLARGVAARETLRTRLTEAQEKELVSDIRLLAVAVACIHHLSYAQILESYEFTEAELIGLLARLDRLRLIELKPNNVIRPLVARAFTWLPQGPIQSFFYAQAQADFFRSRFDGPGEALVFASGRLSRASAARLAERMTRVVQEFRETHIEDLRLPLDERPAMSILVAMRAWDFGLLRALERKSPAPRSKR
ncbi:MAG: helix-turn-helix transcriptional regulator [Burkholderiales bacterium]|nr:helix-turn-helix transcriptional regulator [Burkholderiales bacterium]